MKKYVVITGASSGIGKSAAESFAKKGKNLILVARRKELLEEIKEEILTLNSEIDIIVKDFDLTNIEALPEFYSSLGNYSIETWINNAGFGMLEDIKDHSIKRVESMLKLNVEALTILSILYVKDYSDIEGSQLINISSAAGYIIAPKSIVYCATKFYVSSFTEGLAHELAANKAKLKAKLLAPAATKTEFAAIATNTDNFEYNEGYFAEANSSEEVAGFLVELYESNSTVGIIDFQNFTLKLSDPIFNHLFPKAD
jgi:short-subunit dehydrogenase